VAAQDPHHPSAKAHHTPESDHAAQVLSGALQTTHDHHLKDNVKSTRHLHPLQVPGPVHPSITHEGEGQEQPTTHHPPHDFPLPRLVRRLRVAVVAFMIVRLGLLRLRRAVVALLRGVGRGSIGGIGRMSMLLLLLPLEVLPIRMNDRGRRRVVVVVVLGGRRCRAMVGEGGTAGRVILVIVGGICLLRLRGLEGIFGLDVSVDVMLRVLI